MNKSFLGFEWTSYKSEYGWKEESGKLLSYTFSQVYSISPVFRSVIRRLHNSDVEYRVISLGSDNKLLYEHQKQRGLFANDGGYYSHKTKQIRFVPKDLSGWPYEPISSGGVLFEEFFHAAQFSFYDTKRSKLDIEVEAKFAKAYSGQSKLDYERDFMLKHQNAFKAISRVSGDMSKLTGDEINLLEYALLQLASQVAETYNYDISTYSYDISKTLEFFTTILQEQSTESTNEN